MQQRTRLPRNGRILALAGYLAFSLARGLFAQVDAGAVLGTVKDQSGAVVPNAKVTLTNEGTSFTLSTTTGSDGTYVFTPVKIGTYTVTAEFQGFQKATHPGVVVNVQQQVVVDFTLVPGQVTQTVEVTAAVPLLQTTNASVGQVVGTKEVNDLPLNGRNFIFLAQLTPGVTVGQEEGRGMNATGTFSANGTRPAQNNYLLDGIDNNIDVVDFLNGTQFVVLPAVDAIQEFKVQTSNYSAEIGRAGGAVLNATVKSGTNHLHGDVWEFLRNDKLDAADFFESAGNVRKGEFRQNQFGFTLGGPVAIPRVYNGRNKTFFFGDYEGIRIRQGTPQVTTVPTAAERASGFTDFSDLIQLQLPGGCTKGPDVLGRTVPCGTIFDPATTRPVVAGQPDPVTGTVGPASCPLDSKGNPTCFAREPFSGNLLPVGRVDQNAVKLLNLYPLPNGPGLFNNYTVNPIVINNTNKFDVRVDHNFSERDQIFARVSYFDNPQLKPGPFQGIADGGGFNQGDQTGTSRNGVLSYTHSLTPTTINEARVGFSWLHTARFQANINDLSNIPGQFGIQGVPQVPKNGGMPFFGIGSLSGLGGSGFLVSDEFNTTAQFTENLTKVYHSHTFKGGLEFQHIKFSTLQPSWPRGSFFFGGDFTGIPNQSDGTTGIAQLLLTPIPATAMPAGSSGVDNVIGGPGFLTLSNISNTDDGRNYYGAYFQDDWKLTSKLTLNLGLRWDFFGQVEENFGAQSNFVPGAPFGNAKYLIPVERKKDPLSPSFTNDLAKDGIALEYTDNFGLGNSQKSNFAPRLGFAYQLTPKLVLRGGYGIFYGGFENRGYFPNLGENYPFQFEFDFSEPSSTQPIVFKNGNGTTCGSATFEASIPCIPLDPRLVIADGLTLRGIQFDYITPYTQGANFTVQYQLTPNNSIDLGYVTTLARHLESFPGANNVTKVLPPGTDFTSYIRFPDFGRGASYAATAFNSYYHSLQLKFQRRFSNGLDFLGAYTYSKARSNAGDLLNGTAIYYRAPDLVGFGTRPDYGLADFDVRNVVHFSGSYDLPFGRGRHFLRDTSALANQILGGWSTNWILTLQDGQPVTIPCVTPGAAFAGCFAPYIPGANPIAGKHNVNQYWNPAAFQDPPPATVIGQTDFSPLGGAPSQVIGPGFHRLDWSFFKKFRTSESTYFEFRAEFFNLTNHPNFSIFGANLNYKDSVNFGRLAATRDNPNDPRQIQFALKFYF